MLVGRGYTSKGPGDIPPITTRRLSPVTPSKRAFSQEEELGKLVVGSYSEYNNHFVKAFVHRDYIYFLFSRRDMWHKKEYQTYASRLCTTDRSFYSYMEVPLLCRGGYNLAQGAWLGNHSGEPALFVVMAAGQASTPVATSSSALCIFGMAKLDAMMRRAQEVCYTERGQGSGGQQEAYIEYAVSSTCLKLPKDSLSEYSCGGEHTPNPIASAVPLQATPIITLPTQLTAVAAATEAGHTIAFLGDKEGRLHKVLVRPDGSGDLYGRMQVDDGGAVSADLLLDKSQQHVYVLTDSKLSKVPVSSCERQTDCLSCLSTRDPYCGWCVLEGRCSRKCQCQRHLLDNHWLWSFEPTTRCVTLQTLLPSSHSKVEQTQVTLSVIQLPALKGVESLACGFGHLPPQPAVVMGTNVTCQSPAPELLPALPTESDHMVLPVSLMFGHVTIASGNMTFYECGAVSQLNQNSQCLACVSSVWRCNWCPQDQLCTHNHSCPNKHIILNQRDSPDPTSCPLVFALRSSALVPLSLSTTVVLEGRNLDVYTDEGRYLCVIKIKEMLFNLTAAVERTENNTHLFTCTSTQFQVAVTQLQLSAPVYLLRGHVRIDASPGLTLQLYDCSAGQSDCSQCSAVPQQYGCVWCPGSPNPRCVYSQSCSDVPAETCPSPKITEVLPVSGPLEGGVLLTISGSNLGTKYQDVVGGVMVAGVPCEPHPEEYQVSTRVVCELKSSGTKKIGPVEIKVGSSLPGRSTQIFTYQDPQLMELVPDKGPVSGGTRLTIRGQQLLTGQKLDLSAFLGSYPCYM
ncbi:plexin-B1 [Nematolebias whitei]|uniref:plexin-B1 n=1 Tax=Nematolebias whitei TaxID=451745 RepID=UPI001898A6B9|nr:plexin-B1 [Nematolebias whitei]